jgi:predicted acyl esterase
VAGCVLLAAALVLLVAGGVGAVRVVRGWRRLLALPAAVAALLLVAYPVTIAVMATNVPRPGLGDVTPTDRGLRYEDVSFVTDDGVTLSAWYVPSRTGAALVVRHGASSTRTTVVDQAAVLARHGYGVLLVDARGHGRSGGRAMAFGWHGDADVSAAVSYLAGRPDVDAGRIGAVGFSMGGEEAVGALATEDRLRAVVGEGVENRTFADRAWLPTGWNGWVQRGIDALAYGLTAVLADTAPPRSLRSAVAAADRPVLLVAGRGEERAAHHIAAGAPDDVTVWEAGTGHTDGLAERPDDWERTVVGFLDRHLAG